MTPSLSGVRARRTRTRRSSGASPRPANHSLVQAGSVSAAAEETEARSRSSVKEPEQRGERRPARALILQDSGLVKLVTHYQVERSGEARGTEAAVSGIALRQRPGRDQRDARATSSARGNSTIRRLTADPPSCFAGTYPRRQMTASGRTRRSAAREPPTSPLSRNGHRERPDSPALALRSAEATLASSIVTGLACAPCAGGRVAL